MTEHPAFEDARRLVSAHQVVGFIGSRGTGKTLLAENLRQEWMSNGIRVDIVDAGDVTSSRALEARFEKLLGCSPGELTTTHLELGARVRLIIDRAEKLYDQDWFISLQERWRAFLCEKESRGRAAVIFFGRPRFRQIAGGAGSPLLNIGKVVSLAGLDPNKAAVHFGIETDIASIICQKTGGHLKLSSDLARYLDGEPNVGAAQSEWLRDSEPYLLNLLDDHSLSGRKLLLHLFDNGPTTQAILIHTYFEGQHAAGMEELEDLACSGLVQKNNDAWLPGPISWIQIDGIRSCLVIPQDAGLNLECDNEFIQVSRELFALENYLRELVVETLSYDDHEWWLNGVSAETRGKAEELQQAERSQMGRSGNLGHPILFTTLGELVEIVLTSINWENRIGPRLGVSKASFEATITSIKAVRNQVAHNRPVEPGASALVRGARKRLGLVSRAQP